MSVIVATHFLLARRRISGQLGGACLACGKQGIDQIANAWAELVTMVLAILWTPWARSNRIFRLIPADWRRASTSSLAGLVDNSCRELPLLHGTANCVNQEE